MMDWVAIGLAFTLATAVLGHLFSHVRHLENRIYSAEKYNHKLWRWSRNMLDMYYKHRRDGAPDPDPIPEVDDVK